MQKLVFTFAHQIKANFSTFGEALQYAWKVIRLRFDMQSKAVAFSFKKKNGTTRKAIGTLNMELIPTAKQPNNGISKPSTVVTYFDLEKMDWRSFSATSLL